MRRSSLLAITRRVLECLEADSLETADEARVEPAACFTDPARFRADHDLMARVPHVVGWVGEVPNPGDFTTKDVSGTPVLIVRAGDGRLRAFVNACAHRGAQVATGSGHTARFTCPYHAWSYRTDGGLAGVPSREMFASIDLDGAGLRPLPISDRAGLLTVALHEDIDPEVALDGVADELDADTYTTLHPVAARSSSRGSASSTTRVSNVATPTACPRRCSKASPVRFNSTRRNARTSSISSAPPVRRDLRVGVRVVNGPVRPSSASSTR